MAAPAPYRWLRLVRPIRRLVESTVRAFYGMLPCVSTETQIRLSAASSRLRLEEKHRHGHDPGDRLRARYGCTELTAGEGSPAPVDALHPDGLVRRRARDPGDH